jgi:hypothetical protein
MRLTQRSIAEPEHLKQMLFQVQPYKQQFELRLRIQLQLTTEEDLRSCYMNPLWIQL